MIRNKNLIFWILIIFNVQNNDNLPRLYSEICNKSTCSYCVLFLVPTAAFSYIRPTLSSLAYKALAWSRVKGLISLGFKTFLLLLEHWA